MRQDTLSGEGQCTFRHGNGGLDHNIFALRQPKKVCEKRKQLHLYGGYENGVRGEKGHEFRDGEEFL